MLRDGIPADVPLCDPHELVIDAWERGWQALPRETVSQWADRERIIANGAGAEPGRWVTARNPILREVMDALSDHSPVQEIDWMKSGQIGATEVIVNWASYVIARGSDSMIVSQPTDTIARKWAVNKFGLAVAEMPEIRRALTTDNTLEKGFAGGSLWIISANSSNQLRMLTARYIAADEVDEYPADLNDQGGALDQLATRRKSYGDRGKEYRACTPTIDGASNIAAGYERGDRRKYRVPCPHCGAHQVLDDEQLTPHGTFACVANGCEIEEHNKAKMLRERSACATCGDVPVRLAVGRTDSGALRFVDRCECGDIADPPAPDGAYWEPTHYTGNHTRRSYHAWAAYTPEGLGPSWKEIADQRAEAERDPSGRQAYVNLTLGLPYAGERVARDPEEVATLAERGVYLGVVPRGVMVLTVGIDVQGDRFEAQVVGWDRHQRGRVIDYRVIDGDPTRLDRYGELQEFLATGYRNAHGRMLHMAAVAIDGGNWTETVAQFVAKLVGTSGSHRHIGMGGGMRRQYVYLVRGRTQEDARRAVYRPSRNEVNLRDKTVARSVGVWGVGTNVIKHAIFGWVRAALVSREEALKAGRPDLVEDRMLRFPGGEGQPHDPLRPDPGALTPRYFEGLTAEVYDERKRRWVRRKSGLHNEELDTLGYAYWAALSPAVRIDTMRPGQWDALSEYFEPEGSGEASADAPNVAGPGSHRPDGEGDSAASDADIPEDNTPEDDGPPPPATPSPPRTVYRPQRARRGLRSPGI